MKVGMLTTSYPRYPGDYRGVFIRNLAEAIRARGVEVEVIEPRGYGVLKGGAGLIPNLRRSIVACLVFPVYCLHFLVLAIAKARSCDVLHANWSLSGFFAVIAGRLHRRRVILTERSPFLISTTSAPVNRWMRWVMTRCAAVVTISEAARAALALKFPDIDFGVIPNGVDDRLFAPGARSRAREELALDNGAVHVVTVGRLTPVKRLDTLVAALAAVAGAGHDVRGWIVGDGELREDIERRVAADPVLAGRIVCVGRRTQDEVAKWVAASDIFVLASAAESGGNVVLESMSAGLAVISTPVGWAADFISSGDNGIIVPVGDPASLERELTALVTDPARRAGLGAAARRSIEERGLNWDGCARRYIQRYRELLEAGS